MAKQREAFMAGALAQGISEKKASKIFELMEFFAGYGFNKSHSTAYAFLAYQTAFLKANYPRHFAAALLTIEAANTEKLAVYISESRERGIAVRPPDVNESQLHFTVVPEGVRFGLTAIKGLGEGAIRAMLEARRTFGGRIPSLPALCEVLDLRLVNKRVFEALVKAGACDSLAPAGLDAPVSEDSAAVRQWRARLFASIDSACEHGSRTQRNRDLGQEDLFGGTGDAGAGPGLLPLPAAVPWTEIEQLTYEKDALGLFWSGHPVDRYADDLRRYGARTTGALNVRRDAPGAPDDGEEIGAPLPSAPGASRAAEDASLGGIVAGVRPLKTRKGDRMCVFMLEDAQGSVEVVVFPEAFKQYGHLASEHGRLVLVTGRLERDDESARLLAAEIVPIEMVRERLARSVAIRLSTPPHDRGTFEQLWDVFALHKGDRPVAFDVELQAPTRRLRVTVDVHAQIRVRPSAQLIADVERICGAGSVSLQ
jgi:DNA polymerase-3 subunit alpha